MEEKEPAQMKIVLLDPLSYVTILQVIMKTH